MTTTRETAIAANRARTLIKQAADANAAAIAALLADQGFAQSGEHIVQHPDTGVTVSTTASGYRITFYSSDAPNSMGVVDMPPATTYGVIEQLAVAMSEWLARTA